MAVRAVFLDKDGTLIENVPYNVDPNLISLLPGVKEGLLSLKEVGFKLIVVSNQSGVAKGLFKMSSLRNVEEKLHQLLEMVTFDAFYYCPHASKGSVPEPVSQCTCRKPKPGLLLKAAVDYDIDLSNSWVIGDTLNDIEAGNRAGCKTILVDNGMETEWLINDQRTPTYIALDLSEAVRFILAEKKASPQEEEYAAEF